MTPDAMMMRCLEPRYAEARARRARALALYESGLKRSEVGASLGVSTERARQLIDKEIRYRREDWYRASG
jgi:DNA-binding transcriptional regulator LsrR (DeoR family)